jgi:hypothetical protein
METAVCSETGPGLALKMVVGSDGPFVHFNLLRFFWR